MAQVNVEIPQLGVEFQGAASLPLVGAWVDEEGAAIPGDLPVVTPQRSDSSYTALLKITNPNDVAAVINAIVWTPNEFISDVVASPLPATVPALGSVILSVVITFDGTQTVGAATFMDGAATAETQEA